MENGDVEIACVDCEKVFVWTENEKMFLEKLLAEGKLKDGYGNLRKQIEVPKRCKECRVKRKTAYAKEVK